MKLSNEEIQELKILYQSKIRKLEFELDEYRLSLNQLDKSLTKPRNERGTRRTAKAGSATAKKTTRRGRPAKKAATTTTAATKAAPKRRRGRPAKKAATSTTAAATAKAAPKRRRGRPAKKAATTKAATTATTKAAPKKRRGRPAKKAASTTASATTPTRARRGRKTAAPKKKAAPKARATKAAAKPKKAADTKGYRLNEWDDLVLKTLNDMQKIAVFSDFLDRAKAKSDKEKLGLDEKKLYSRINQSLHKLANKRDTLIKVDTEGRGFAYGMQEWKSPGSKDVQSKFK